MDELIHILIVDDEPKNLTVLETILDDPGYRLVRAGSADEALLALVGGEFAVLILDISMPGMTGFELAQMIKDRKKTSRVPIIFLTAYYNEDEHVLEGYGTGAVDFLHKPVNAAILRSKVAVFADLHRKDRELTRANRALMAEVTERSLVEERLREFNDTLEKRVTDRTEALRESDRRKDEFLATLAHELRNPLAAIRNGTDLWKREKDDPRVREHVYEMVERQSGLLIRLVDDLLDVSRITQGKIELRKERIELTDVIAHAIEISQHVMDSGSHALTTHFESRPIPMIGDRARLAQVFSNLLNNAAKFSVRPGPITLDVVREGNEVVVRVRDRGIGIPTAMLPRIFDLFTQVDQSLEKTHGGLGIGLSLVKGMVELHRGTVIAQSDGEGRGSTFVVRLPIVEEDVCVPNRTVESERGLSGPTRHRILVVDDNRDAADSLALILEIHGNEVRTAYDGLSGVRSAEEFKPAVILMDIGMPKLNGYDAARQIRSQEWGRSMTLVALSGWGQEKDRTNSAEAGFNYHYIKPVETETILDLLKTLRTPVL
jgi:signal transduction histidine kinase